MKTSKGWVKAEGHYFLKLDFCLEYWKVSNADPDNRILFFNSRDNFLIYYFDFYVLYSRGSRTYAQAYC